MTPPCYLTISQKVMHDLITDLVIPSSYQAFKNALLPPLGEFEGFGGQKPPCLFARPCNKPFSAPDSNGSVWPHCASAMGTYVH